MNITFAADITATAPKKLGRFAPFNTRTLEFWPASFSTKKEAQDIVDGWHFENRAADRGLMIITKV